MIDLHSHILPKVDDGAADLLVSLDMARKAVDAGTTHMACTPHITPGLYRNTKSKIAKHIKEFAQALEENHIELELFEGADVHIAPDLILRLNKGEIPTLNGTKYFLFEPFQRIIPPMMIELCQALLDAGYRPILTHPERLDWIEDRYDLICKLHTMGLPIQLTAASITGDFGRTAKYWSDRIISENRVDIIASDAHNTNSHPPGLSAAYEVLIKRMGERKANEIVIKNPRKIVANQNLSRHKNRLFTKMTSRTNTRGFFSFLGN